MSLDYIVKVLFSMDQEVRCWILITEYSHDPVCRIDLFKVLILEMIAHGDCTCEKTDFQKVPL